MADADTSKDNNYTGSPVGALTAEEAAGIVPVPESFTLPVSEETLYYYRHKGVARFSIPIGDGSNKFWDFKDGICAVPESQVNAFVAAVRGLHRGDSGNIVQILNIQNEAPVASLAVRGPASTATIVAKTADGAIPSDVAKPSANAKFGGASGLKV